MRRKGLILITTVFAVFAMAGFAFAANQGNVNVTSEPVAQGTICSKAGGFSIEFDAGTILVAGDTITIDLDLGVTLCKDIDLLISPSASAVGSGWGASTPTSGAPVTAPTGFVGQTGSGVVFLITGNSGSARMTLDVLEADLNGDGTLGNDTAVTTGSLINTGANADDKIILNFLDQKTNSVNFTVQPGIWSNTDFADYAEAATLAQNTICIDVSDFTGTTVNGNMDSELDKFTFIPSNPQIAHIVAAAQYQLEDCKDRETGFIEMGSTVLQGSDSCDFFENETASGFCSGTHANNRLIIQSVNGAFATVDYDVTLEILVNGATGDNGVYFSNTALASQGYDTEDDACTSSGLSGVGGVHTYFNSSGAALTPAAPASDDCSVDTADRAVKYTIVGDDLDISGNNDYLSLDLPPFNYDLDEISEGDVVSIRVTLTQTPCTVLITDDWDIGTFTSTCGTSNCLLYPYYTMTASTDSWWDGIVIDNLGSTDGTATITVYEQDGDVGTASVSVSALSLYVALLSNITFTPDGNNSGTLGDSPLYLYVSTTFATDGFAMIARTSTGESMGYLPRNSKTGTFTCP